MKTMKTNNDGTTYRCDSCGMLEDACHCGDFVSTRPATVINSGANHISDEQFAEFFGETKNVRQTEIS